MDQSLSTWTGWCRVVLLSAGLIVLLLGCLAAGSGDAVHGEPVFDAGHAGFTVVFGNATLTHRVMAVFVMPGETIDVLVGTEGAGAGAAFVAEAGTTTPAGNGRWRWTVPALPGLVKLRIEHRGSGGVMDLNAFVLVPRTRIRDGYLNGYHVGSYPTIPLKGMDIYMPPDGLVEVTAENENTPVGPHFTLGQFVCKQQGGYPKYLVLRTRLIQKLELILTEINRRGVFCPTFEVMSGYRTPFYNKAIGNVKYSRHVWGGAADIYVDAAPRDGVMDDLNGDGVFNVEDAGVLYEVIDELFGQDDHERFVGGLGRYRKTEAHGPFVHVDVRGFRARWWD